MSTLRRLRKRASLAWIYAPFRRFFQLQASSSILLLLCVLAALGLANSPLSAGYFAFWNASISIILQPLGLPPLPVSETLLLWINEGLMTVFFLMVGLELKRSVLVGELSNPKDAAFPIVSAVGGMLVPALIYGIVNAGAPTAIGWAIPTATDIAFALGLLALLGKRIPIGLRIFLSTLAIADDIGAVLVIALVFRQQLVLAPLLVGMALLGVMFLVSRTTIRTPSIYLVLGIGVWLGFLFSGVHATIAGVLVAMIVPARPLLNTEEFCNKGEELLRSFESSAAPGKSILANREQYAAAEGMRGICQNVTTPLQRLEGYIEPWVTYAVIPLFALANAGVSLLVSTVADFTHLVLAGVVAGLVIGKPIGISFFAWLSVRLGIAKRPAGVGWSQIVSTSFLAGIGFTMSLFIASLAFEGSPILEVAKEAILLGSLISGTLGFLMLGGKDFLTGPLQKLWRRIRALRPRTGSRK